MRLKSFLLVLSLLFLPLLCHAGQVDTSDVLWQKNLSVTCYCLAFSPDSRLLASGCQVVTYIWDVATGKLVQTLTPGYSTVSLNFSPDGRYLATGGHTGQVTIWNTQTWAKERDINDGISALNEGAVITFTHDNSKLIGAFGGGKGILIFDTQNWNLIKSLDSLPIDGGISVSYDDRYIAVSYFNQTYIYDMILNSIVKTIKHVWEPKFSPIRNEIVGSYWADTAGVTNKGLIYYKLDTGDSTYINVNNVNDFAFSPDGNFISMANINGFLETWSLSNNQNIYSYYFPGTNGPLANSFNSLYIADYTGYIELLGARWTQTGIIEPDIVSFKAFPNPSNTELEIEFSIQNSENAEIEIIDINGKINKILNSTYFTEGKQHINFNAQDLPDGAYTLRFRHGGRVETKKIVIAR